MHTVFSQRTPAKVQSNLNSLSYITIHKNWTRDKIELQHMHINF